MLVGALAVERLLRVLDLIIKHNLRAALTVLLVLRAWNAQVLRQRALDLRQLLQILVLV